MHASFISAMLVSNDVCGRDTVLVAIFAGVCGRVSALAYGNNSSSCPRRTRATCMCNLDLDDVCGRASALVFVLFGV